MRKIFEAENANEMEMKLEMELEVENDMEMEMEMEMVDVRMEWDRLLYGKFRYYIEIVKFINKSLS